MRYVAVMHNIAEFDSLYTTTSMKLPLALANTNTLNICVSTLPSSPPQLVTTCHGVGLPVLLVPDQVGDTEGGRQLELHIRVSLRGHHRENGSTCLRYGNNRSKERRSNSF